MDEASRALRARIDALELTGRGRRYPDELQRDLLAYVARARRRGATVVQVSTFGTIRGNLIAARQMRWRGFGSAPCAGRS